MLRAEHVAYADTGLAVPDTVTGLVGLIGEMSRSKFKVVTASTTRPMLYRMAPSDFSSSLFWILIRRFAVSFVLKSLKMVYIRNESPLCWNSYIKFQWTPRTR